MGNREVSVRYLREALALARQVGDRRRELLTCAILAAESAMRGASEEAQQIYVEASASVRGLEEQALANFELVYLGEIARYSGHLDEAEHWHQQALSLALSTGDRQHQELATADLGLVAQQRGDTATAHRAFEEGLALARQLGAPYSVGWELNALGELTLSEGEFEAALQYFAEALLQLEQVSDPQLVLHVQGNLALARGQEALRQGDMESAQRNLRDASHLFDQSDPIMDFRDQRSAVEQLLATLVEKAPTIASPAAPEVDAASTKSQVKKSRWPWSRK
jgi:tetratricopeptide (TPR) repeat protein